jgi:3-dehydroquinate synthase
MQVITVKSAIRNYDVCFTESASFVEDLQKLANRFYVIDERVWQLYRDSAFEALDPAHVMLLPVHEDKKNLDTVTEIYDELMARSAKRNMTLVSIGGGIVQDVTGFAASTLYRGLNWVFVPTTLLAQSDSCIGSKTSLNYKSFKNLVGTFYPPSRIYLYPGFLHTLNEEDYYSGLGEVIKLHLIGGSAHLERLMPRMESLRKREGTALLDAITGALNVKLAYLDDEFDTGKRNMLNFGHCFGHALEATTNFAIPHGQAVMTGMVFANIAARNRKLMSDTLHRRLLDEVLLPNIVSRPRAADLKLEPIYAAMKMDKKRVGEALTLIMQTDDFSMTKVTDFQYAELAKAMEELNRLVCAP